MTIPEILVYEIDLLSGYDTSNPREFLSIVQKAIEDIPQDAFDTKVEIDAPDEGPGTLRLVYKRKETAPEYEARLERERQRREEAAKRQERSERTRLAELKAKYEGGSK